MERSLEKQKTPTAPIASRTHTAILASAFILLAIAGGYAQHTGRVQQAAPSEHQAIQLYVTVLIAEWASVYYVWKGTRGRNVTLSSLVGGRWQSPKAVATDVVLAAALWGIWIGIESALPGTNTAQSLLPRTPLEFGIWMLLALSAGFCEELVFRGYFQRQFHALTGSAGRRGFAGARLRRGTLLRRRLGRGTNHGVRPALRAARGLAQEPPPGHAGACVVGHLRRHTLSLTARRRKSSRRRRCCRCLCTSPPADRDRAAACDPSCRPSGATR